ncbi:MAG TPA: hypothetical protein VFN90_03045 [Gemmatimonadales bacterium]|nr:hypothetical protein [Gemmatimonadales bacterium]
MIARLLAAVLVLAVATLPIAAQAPQAERRVGQGQKFKSKAEDLWPERPLSPPEEELRTNVVVLRDTLFTIDATASRVLRANEAGKAAVVTSGGRALGVDCARGVRATGVMSAHARGLSTSNKKWGDGALNTFRAALVDLDKQLRRCEALGTVKAGMPVPSTTAFAEMATGTIAAIRRYEVAQKGLFRTLEIPLDPKGYKSAVDL